MQPSGTEADLTRTASSFGFVTTDSLPTPKLDADTVAIGPDAQLSGTLAGIAWSADVSDGPLRTITVSVGGYGSGGFENDRLSQPDDTGVAGATTSITGVPGHGAIVYGYGPAKASTIRAETSGGVTGGVTVELPLYRPELESYFAVPVPEGVAVTTLTLLAEDGTHVATIDVPALPAGLGGTYGGVVSTDQSPQSMTPKDAIVSPSIVNRHAVLSG